MGGNNLLGVTQGRGWRGCDTETGVGSTTWVGGWVGSTGRGVVVGTTIVSLVFSSTFSFPLRVIALTENGVNSITLIDSPSPDGSLGALDEELETPPF